jgi:hypothetical protein
VTKGNYEDRENFLKAIKRFQGKQPNKLPSDLLDKIDQHFGCYGFPTCSEVRNMAPELGRQKMSKEKMYTALQRIGYSGFYEDINLICHLAWGWELPNISGLEIQLMSDYDLSQKVYNEINQPGQSCPNVQYRLFRHLQRLGHSCTQKDFKIIQTEEILNNYESKWKVVCEQLTWVYVPLSD